MRYLDRTDPIAGKNIELHMDARLQQAAEEALGEFRGAVVAIEPATGGILAMVSKPGFDPNLFVTGISSKDYSVLVTDEVNTPLFDRTTNPYPPGSTVKPFLGLAGFWIPSLGACGAFGALGVWNHQNSSIARLAFLGWLGIIGVIQTISYYL